MQQDAKHDEACYDALEVRSRTGGCCWTTNFYYDIETDYRTASRGPCYSSTRGGRNATRSATPKVSQSPEEGREEAAAKAAGHLLTHVDQPTMPQPVVGFPGAIAASQPSVPALASASTNKGPQVVKLSVSVRLMPVYLPSLNLKSKLVWEISLKTPLKDG